MNPGISQSNLIFGTMFLAFIVFITMRGKLPKYLDVLVGNGQAGGGGGNSGSGGDSAAGLGDILSDPVGAITGQIRRGVTSAIGSGLGRIGDAIGSIGGLGQ